MELSKSDQTVFDKMTVEQQQRVMMLKILTL